MNDHDLLDRMAASTDWTRSETIDPSHDVSRGQARLRRRRIGVAATTVASVGVAVLAAGPIAGQWMTSQDRPPVVGASSTAPAAGSAAAHCADRKGFNLTNGRVQPGGSDVVSANATRLMRAFGRHADPSGRYLSAGPYSVSLECSTARVPAPSMEVLVPWREGSAEDRVRVAVSSPGEYDDPQLGKSYAHPHLSACRNPAWPAFTPYSCDWKTVDGKRVLVGVSTLRGYLSYLVGYVRPDGQLVTVRVESGVHTDPRTEQPANPVRKPSVTVEQLAAVATDPDLTLR